MQRIVSAYLDMAELQAIRRIPMTMEDWEKRLSMQEIIDNDFNLNISRYVSTAQAEKEVDLVVVHAELVQIEQDLAEPKARHNTFLVELGLEVLP